ncbi:MAG: hypothetical protein ACOVOR_02770 [Rhabdochlamydiaceae bacterium]
MSINRISGINGIADVQPVRSFQDLSGTATSILNEFLGEDTNRLSDQTLLSKIRTLVEAFALDDSIDGFQPGSLFYDIYNKTDEVILKAIHERGMEVLVDECMESLSLNAQKINNIRSPLSRSCHSLITEIKNGLASFCDLIGVSNVVLADGKKKKEEVLLLWASLLTFLKFITEMQGFELSRTVIVVSVSSLLILSCWFRCYGDKITLPGFKNLTEEMKQNGLEKTEIGYEHILDPLFLQMKKNKDSRLPFIYLKLDQQQAFERALIQNALLDKDFSKQNFYMIDADDIIKNSEIYGCDKNPEKALEHIHKYLGHKNKCVVIRNIDRFLQSDQEWGSREQSSDSTKTYTKRDAFLRKLELSKLKVIGLSSENLDINSVPFIHPLNNSTTDEFYEKYLDQYMEKRAESLDTETKKYIIQIAKKVDPSDPLLVLKILEKALDKIDTIFLHNKLGLQYQVIDSIFIKMKKCREVVLKLREEQQNLLPLLKKASSEKKSHIKKRFTFMEEVIKDFQGRMSEMAKNIDKDIEGVSFITLNKNIVQEVAKEMGLEV